MDDLITVAITVATPENGTRRKVNEQALSSTVPTPMSLVAGTRGKVEETSYVTTVPTSQETRGNVSYRTAPATVAISLSNMAAAGRKVDWKGSSFPSVQTGDCQGFPFVRGEDVYGGVSSDSRNSLKADHWDREGENHQDRNPDEVDRWATELCNGAIDHMQLQDRGTSGASAKSNGQPSSMPGCFSQMGDTPASFQHPNVTRRKNRVVTTFNGTGSVKKVNEEEIRQMEVQKREETEKEFQRLMMSFSPSTNQFLMNQSTREPLKEDNISQSIDLPPTVSASHPMATLTEQTKGLNLEEDMDTTSGEVYWEEWIKRRMLRLGARFANCLSIQSVEEDLKETVIIDIKEICDEERCTFTENGE